MTISEDARALAEVDMILGVVGADRDIRRKLLCALRDRATIAERDRDEARAELSRLRRQQHARALDDKGYE